MASARPILMPLPDHDFDVTEVAVPWRLLTRAGHEVVFATEHGAWPAADPLLLTGVIFGQLGADQYYRTHPAYEEAEVRAALHDPATQFVRGKRTLVARGTAQDDSAAQVVEDGRCLSARWPGDADLLARKFRELLEARPDVGDQCS